MRLLLVYNADEGFFNALTDSAHKLLAPETYACGLCYYTHGTFGMKRPFKTFLERLPVPVAFYHRAEFRRAYGRTDLDLPAVLWDDERGGLEVIVPAEALAVDPQSQDAGLQTLMTQIEVGVTERLAAS